MADWVLVRRIGRIVGSAPGGGLHRDELCHRMGLVYGSGFRDALMTAYGRGMIDFCGQYVVRPRRIPSGGGFPACGRGRTRR